MSRKYVVTSRTGSTSTNATDTSFRLLQVDMPVTSGLQYAVFFSGVASMESNNTTIQTWLLLGDRGGVAVARNVLGETYYVLNPSTAKSNKIPIAISQVWRSDVTSRQKFEVRARGDISNSTITISDSNLFVLEISGSETASSTTGSSFTTINSSSAFTELRGITLASGSYYLFGAGQLERSMTNPPTIQSSSIITIRLRNSSSATTIPIQTVQSLGPIAAGPTLSTMGHLIFAEVSHSVDTRYTLEFGHFESQSFSRYYRSAIFALKKDQFSGSSFTIDTASSTTTSNTLQNKLTVNYVPTSSYYLVLGNWTTLTSHVDTSSISDFTLNGISSFSSSRLPTHRQTDTAQETLYTWCGVPTVNSGSSNEWIIKYSASGSGGSVTIKNTELLLLNLGQPAQVVLKPLSFGYILL